MVYIIFLWDFPSVSLASDPKNQDRGGTALWVFCLPTGPKMGDGQGFPPSEYITMTLVSSNTILWIYLPWNNLNLFRSHF